MEHHFNGPSYTLGIEEELMIVNGETYDLVNAIERLLDDVPDGEIKPELMESVLEVSTHPCSNTAEAGEQLRALRRNVREKAQGHGLAIGSAGTHPFALWEQQRIVGRTRYRDLISALRFVARQELIFGMHVHIGVDDADKAVHVANGMRVHLPVLLALSANSPFWRSDASGLMSTRTPIFRAFPRVGIPPAYRDWDDYSAQIEFMVASGVMEDYTYLWYDVRPHPWQMLDENKWLAARHGLDGELIDLPSNERVATKTLARRLVDRLRGHAEDLGSAADLDGVIDLMERGNGAERQLVVYEANRDFTELMREIVEATVSH
jgi:carboxylate-amine ligase